MLISQGWVDAGLGTNVNQVQGHPEGSTGEVMSYRETQHGQHSNIDFQVSDLS